MLTSELAKHDLSIVALPFNTKDDSYTSKKIEEVVAKCTGFVLILSANVLSHHGAVFALYAAYKYDSVRPILVHGKSTKCLTLLDAETCFFPAYNTQPSHVKPVFSEKALTYLRDYPESVAQQIIDRVKEQEHSNARSSEKKHINPDECKTRLFLR